jgi:hypothetical protein
MAQTCYPVFQEGQTLTRDDLTLLRDFLDDRARQVARAVGFGISCGLDGEITTAGGPAVVIDPGVAIDQAGEILTLEAPVRIDLPPAATETGFDFMEAVAGTFTAVLVAREVETPAPDCDEEGCEGHAATRCRMAELVMVPGRLTGGFDFASEPLVADHRPLTANPTAAAFTTLRGAISTRLDDTLSAAAKAKLASISIAAADLPAIRNAKAGFLNQVLFAALDLLRCRALLELACLREAAKPGVALGWAHQVGGAWEWDCGFRHAWEPPAGMSVAFVGGACDDACKLHRDRLESLILTFELPSVPAPSDPPKGGGTDPGPYLPCGRLGKSTGKFNYLIWEDCGLIFEPPLVIPDDWPDHWIDLGPGFPPDIGPTPPWEIYVNPVPDYFDEGLINLKDSYGRDPLNVLEGLETAIDDAGLAASVQVLTLDEAQNLDGFMISSSASPADTIVLVKDQFGKVTQTGIVAAQTGFRDASSAIPAATAAAAAAVAATETLAGIVDGHGETLSELGPDLQLLLDFRTESLEKFDGLDGVVAGLDDRLTLEAEQILGQYQATIGPFLDKAVLDAVGTVQKDLNERIDLKTDATANQLFEQMSKVDERSSLAFSAAERSNERIDQVLSGRAVGMGFGEIGRQAAFNEELIGTLRGFSGAIEGAAPEPQKAAVREQLKGGREALGRMEAGVRAGTLVLQDEREPLAQVLESMVGGLKAAGASAAQVKEMQASVKGLMEKLQ